MRGEHCRHSATFCVKSALPLLAHCVLRESREKGQREGGRERGEEQGSSQEEGREGVWGGVKI